MIAAAGGTAMVTGLYPVLPQLNMWIERRRQKRDMPPGQLRALAREWAIGVAMTAARPVGILGLPVALRARVGPRPIIMVHGYGMGRTSFLPLAYRLTRAGLGPILGFEYWSLGKTASAARSLGRYIEAVCDATQSPSVDVIGHSMGGVVARYHVTLGGGSERVKNLITIGSPHRGTAISVFGIGSAHKELFTDSVLVQRLDAAPRPASTRMTVIWSRGDALVSEARHAHVPGADEISYDDLGHLTMLASPAVAGVIIDRLRR